MPLSLPDHCQQSLRRIAAICVLGGVLGLIYNASNPGGLTWNPQPAPPFPPSQPPATALPAAAATTSVAGPHLSVAGSYQNTRISFVAASAPPSGSPYSNETIAIQPGAPVSSASPAGLRATTWLAVKDEIAAGRSLLVDSRTAAAYGTGHIPGAVLLPFAQLDSNIQAFKHKHPPSTPLVIYCGNNRCVISKSLAEELSSKHGYTNLRYIPGGYLEWVQSQAR